MCSTERDEPPESETKMSQPVMVFASFVPGDAQTDAVRDILLGMRTATRQEPGCERYDLFSAGSDGRATFHLIERYRDAAALDDHRASDHYKAYRASITELLDEPIGVVVLSEVE
jgi:quinol monooxygenase YgiN